MRTPSVLHQGIQEHFASWGFLWREGTEIMSANPKLLFNISGGVVFEDVIGQNVVPEFRRVASIQNCLRTDGWQKIGFSGRHHLAFEMLGHFSLYEGGEREVKSLMIESAWRYLTQCVGLNRSSLSATVHPQDTATQIIWSRLGVPTIANDKNITITPLRNRCGVRTEVMWQNPHSQALMELWNLVFTQFEGDTLFINPMKKIAADSGMGLDRLVTAAECCSNNYENSNWKSVIEALTVRMPAVKTTLACRLADLGKASVLLISQGLVPSNKAAAYVLRKIVREAYVVCLQTRLPFDNFCSISVARWCPEGIAPNAVFQVFAEEMQKFESSLERGRKEYQRLLIRNQGELTAENIEYLSSTFGYPRASIEVDSK